MNDFSASDIREMILEVVAKNSPRVGEDNLLQMNTVLAGMRERLGRPTTQVQQLVLSEWHRLICSGHFAWGRDWSNPGPPFFHVTERGQRALVELSRNPANPIGYMRHIESVAAINLVALSYLREALACFGAQLYKAAAVMLGGASESVILELRDVVVAKHEALNIAVPGKLTDWRTKVLVDALRDFFEARKKLFPRELREEFEAYFQAFPQPIRAARNEAGHPSSVDPVREDAVHASLLLFPELVRLATALRSWVDNEMVR